MYAGCAGKTVTYLENACHTWALRGVFTTRRYTNTRLPNLYLYLQAGNQPSADWGLLWEGFHATVLEFGVLSHIFSKLTRP